MNFKTWRRCVALISSLTRTKLTHLELQCWMLSWLHTERNLSVAILSRPPHYLTLLLLLLFGSRNEDSFQWIFSPLRVEFVHTGHDLCELFTPFTITNCLLCDFALSIYSLYQRISKNKQIFCKFHLNPSCKLFKDVIQRCNRGYVEVASKKANKSSQKFTQHQIGGNRELDAMCGFAFHSDESILKNVKRYTFSSTYTGRKIEPRVTSLD